MYLAEVSVRRVEDDHPHLCQDGIVMKRTWAGEVRNASLLVASAVNAEEYREILGICEGAKEDKSGWSAFLRHLVNRGLNGVQLIISDACRRLVESIADYLPDARWQRCLVHFYRNVISHVPSTKVREVSHMLKAIHAQESREAALVEESIGETLTYLAFSHSHWRKLRTNNPLERFMKDTRQRTRVVGAFPDGQSCLILAAARFRHIAAGKWATRRYMDMKPLFEEKTSTQGAVA